MPKPIVRELRTRRAVHLARWLVRHLDDPRLVIWIAQRGGQLHDRWQRLVEHELDRFAALERDGKTAELAEIRSQAPNAMGEDLARQARSSSRLSGKPSIRQRLPWVTVSCPQPWNNSRGQHHDDQEHGHSQIRGYVE